MVSKLESPIFTKEKFGNSHYMAHIIIKNRKDVSQLLMYLVSVDRIKVEGDSKLHALIQNASKQ